MGKPAYIMFVGVESLSEEDELRLPEAVRKVYRTGFDEDFIMPEDEEVALVVEVVGGLKIEYFTEGKPDTADPGPTIGFGVVIHREWWDSGVATCNPGEIAAKAEHAMTGLTQRFDEWGLEARPCFLNACVWVS